MYRQRPARSIVCLCVRDKCPVSAQRRRIQLSKPRPVPSRFQRPRNKASCPHALQRRNVHPATLRILLPPGGGAAGFARSRSPARRLLPPRASTHPLHASEWMPPFGAPEWAGYAAPRRGCTGECGTDGRTDNEEGKKEFGGRVVALRSYCIFGSFFRNLLGLRCQLQQPGRRSSRQRCGGRVRGGSRCASTKSKAP
jgi:hypothetical protein